MSIGIAWTPIQREPSPEVMRLLRLAEEGDERIHATIVDPAHDTYLHQVGDNVIGVVTMHWHAPDSEIIYLAVAPEQQGKGYGKAIISGVIEEAQRRQIARLVVGTGNSSLANIGFYQKCGFRMDHVRRDFYDYIQPPISEDGISLRDMLVFSLDVEEVLSSIRSG